MLKGHKQKMSDSRPILYVYNVTRQIFLSLGIVAADTHLARLRGLMGKLKLRNNEGIWVVPCNGIHTIGLLFSIDVIYLDDHNEVIHVIERLGPLRIAAVRRKCSSVLELPPGTIRRSNTRIGDTLLICSPEEIEAYWKDIKSQSHDSTENIEATG